MMKINQFGSVTLSVQEIFEGLYSGKISTTSSLFLDDPIEVSKFTKSKNINADSIMDLQNPPEHNLELIDFHRLNQTKWFMPENYCVNLFEELYQSCSTQEQIERVNTELELFAQHNMIELLFFLKYLVDTLRKNNIVWGVGRGSSVASYVLFLIGVHKIDSIKYGLDIKEFLR